HLNLSAHHVWALRGWVDALAGRIRANDFSIGMEFKESENELAPVSEIDQNNHGSLVDLSIMNVQRSGDQSGD
ncbi:hypothetical protein, partial [Pseudomonas savastanoi]|uniref:hypothetical protein n=1 Tax=Pseudomonas savastanoi TaxID=29438 RepID=UPI001C819303